MARQKKPVKQTREHYADEYKAEALKLAQSTAPVQPRKS
jgi:hypothetical protein